ncbi:MAG TPA: hypothetical protein VHS99_24280 [Chloroflexota bacterium]|nr:hypothetical protein [Chloroflexota bacterium]
MINPDNAERRLFDAETKLAQALRRLHALRRAALAGAFDPTEFDQALVAYRQAEKEALEAREALATAHQQAAQPVAAATQGSVGLLDEVGLLEPTSRMRFVRWLVENGRLSDWKVSELA